ncbi:MAG: universal stress protein [Planctomycetia bacterium]|nr:universal stress protein [Planctomycetia bacterium]
MKTRKILFPTDFSSKGEAALEYAAALARERNALLVIVHVQEPPVMYGDGAYYYGAPEPDADVLRNMLLAVKPHDSAVACDYRFVQGLPAQAILSAAKEQDVDLIVMSSHGRTGLSRLLMGSVAEEVMRGAACPVMVVKPTAKVDAAVAVGLKP